MGDRFQRMNLYVNIANKVALLKRACQLLIWIKRTYRIETFIEVIVLRFRKETLYRNAVQRQAVLFEESVKAGECDVSASNLKNLRSSG